MPSWIDRIFQQLRDQAEDHVNNEIKQQELMENADRKIARLRRGGMISNLLEDIKVLFEMVKSYMRGEYRDVPLETIIAIIIAIIYFVMPVDVVPDFIPGGFFDDALVFTFVLNSIRGEIDVFRGWKINKMSEESKKGPENVK